MGGRIAAGSRRPHSPQPRLLTRLDGITDPGGSTAQASFTRRQKNVNMGSMPRHGALALAAIATAKAQADQADHPASASATGPSSTIGSVSPPAQQSQQHRVNGSPRRARIIRRGFQGR